MTDIPRNIGRQALPSGRTGGVAAPLSIGDTGQGVIGRGLAALGGGITDLGQALSQIEQAEGTSQASTAIGQADSERRLSSQRLLDINDPDERQAEFDASQETIKTFTPPSRVGAFKYEQFIKQSTPSWTVDFEIAGIIKRKSLIEGAYIGDWNSAIQKGDLVEADRLTVEARDDTGVITPQEAANRLNESPSLVVQSQVTAILNNASQFVSKGNPDSAILEVARAEIILNDPKLNINPKTEESLRASAKATKRSVLSTQRIAQQNNADDFLVQISQGKVPAATTIRQLEADLATNKITGDDFKSLRTFALNPSVINKPRAVDAVSTAISQVGDDTRSLESAKKVLRENASGLKPEKVTEFTEELNKAFDTSTDTAFSRVRTDVKLRAVGKSEGILDRLIEALTSKPTDKALEDRVATAREKFNFELDNFNKWEQSLRAWRRKNADASPEQIQSEGMRSWRTEFSGKGIEELRSEFGFVKIRLPNGQTGRIPASNLSLFLKQGAVEIE